MNNITKISLFKNQFSTKPYDEVLLKEFYNAILNGKFKNEIDTIRSNSEKEAKLMKDLPCVTISGIFRELDTSGLICQSGRICISIEALQNSEIEDWNCLRDTLGVWKEVEFAALSASGKGLILVIMLKYPKKYISHYLALEKSFKELGIVIDPTCYGISRLQILSYDSDAILNKKVIPYSGLFQLPKPQSFYHKDKDNGLYDLIDEIEAKELDITGDYSQSSTIAKALGNAFGELGRSYFHRISQYSPKYNQFECDCQFDKCLKMHNKYNLATIFNCRNKLK
ncbi:MAG: PriCT-2 domain-containing protein [Bacteroidales bacterium]|nr:PriCT-2 domain-containing protein [Bacteroidales bacterium]